MDIKAFQQALIAAGYPLPRFGADGSFGAESRTAMQRFQNEVGIPVTQHPKEATAKVLSERLGSQASKDMNAFILGAPFSAFNQPKATRPITEIIIHCTATPEGRDVSVDTIRKWHKDQGWNDIGYHWVVGLDGVPRPGRPEAKVGAHVAGHNTGTLGVVYVGGVDARNQPKDTRNAAQRAGLVSIVRGLKLRYPSITKVTGHNQYAAKACPSFDVRTDPLSRL